MTEIFRARVWEALVVGREESLVLSREILGLKKWNLKFQRFIKLILCQTLPFPKDCLPHWFCQVLTGFLLRLGVAEHLQPMKHAFWVPGSVHYLKNILLTRNEIIILYDSYITFDGFQIFFGWLSIIHISKLILFFFVNILNFVRYCIWSLDALHGIRWTNLFILYKWVGKRIQFINNETSRVHLVSHFLCLQTRAQWLFKSDGQTLTNTVFSSLMDEINHPENSR